MNIEISTDEDKCYCMKIQLSSDRDNILYDFIKEDLTKLRDKINTKLTSLYFDKTRHLNDQTNK